MGFGLGRERREREKALPQRHLFFAHSSTLSEAFAVPVAVLLLAPLREEVGGFVREVLRTPDLDPVGGLEGELLRPPDLD